ncbi:hypothetical protein FHX15_005936 [Rhizobium sp. BK650]|uniref:hypothetical protein n=1 Tax=Rhizobium sp. BK650 TaxID=2586990 RepID=UPI0016204D4D|nr:hypothetical protein [Rhizobium sp. BK650]MBB3660665.1 hypothetical protein [Rhizobium sp. BK650]
MTESAVALTKLRANYAMYEEASRQLRRLPVFAVGQEGNDHLMSLLKKLNETEDAATTISRA